MAAGQGSAGAAGDSASPGGLLYSLRAIGPAIAGLMRTRLELFGIELSEEKARAATFALLAGLALVFGAFALLMVNILILVWFWDTHRLGALLGMTGFYTAAAVACLLRLKAHLAARPPMFEATMAELKADIEALNRARQD
jgi:uncharacterized membrane protein YqjE